MTSAVEMLTQCGAGQRQPKMFVLAIAPVPDSLHIGDVDFFAGFKCAVALDPTNHAELRARLHDAANALIEAMTSIP